MIKLSDRLELIANEINKGETMADVGTDHGFLPLSLWERGICPHVILGDISAPSLKKAEDNARDLYPNEKFDLRLGSGIEILEKGEVDVLVLAGMGGILMTDILGKDIEKTKSIKRLVLQPRTDVGRLVYWLYRNGFSLDKEQLVREGKYICEILTAVPRERAFDRKTDEDDVEYEFPMRLLDDRCELTEEYLNRHLEKEKLILEKKSGSASTDEKEIRRQKHRVSYLEYLLNQLKSRE